MLASIGGVIFTSAKSDWYAPPSAAVITPSTTRQLLFEATTGGVYDFLHPVIAIAEIDITYVYPLVTILKSDVIINKWYRLGEYGQLIPIYCSPLLCKKG
jgi:hypothetical protein